MARKGYLEVARLTGSRFIRSTGVSGASNAGRVRLDDGLISRGRLLGWTALFLLGGALTIYNTASLFEYYYTYPISTKVEVTTAPQVCEQYRLFRVQ